MNDPYISPDGVLRNRLGISDPVALEAAEADITAARDSALHRRRIRGEYDLAHLQAFRRFIFGDLYEAASIAGFRGDLKPLIVMLDKHVLREG